MTNKKETPSVLAKRSGLKGAVEVVEMCNGEVNRALLEGWATKRPTVLRLLILACAAEKNRNGVEL